MAARLSTQQAAKLGIKPKRGNKYGARKTEWAGIIFDSKREAERYKVLCLLQLSGDIKKLDRQVRYNLWHPEAEKPICAYVADFDYIDVATGERVTEDVKGVETAVFKLKAKLFKANTGRDIRIVK